MSGMFAGQHNLNHGELVLIHSLESSAWSSNVSNCEKIYVEPIFEDDYELLYTHHTFIESNLLNQIRIVSSGLIFPIFITSEANLQVFVKVTSVSPSNRSCLILHEMTELHLTSVKETAASDSSNVSRPGGQQQSQPSLFGGILNTFSNLLNKTPIAEVDGGPRNESIRICPIKVSSTFKPLRVVLNRAKVDHWNTIFVHPVHFDTIGESGLKLARLKVLLSPDQKLTKTTTSGSQDGANQGQIFEERHFLDTFVNVHLAESCPVSDVLVCDTLQRQLGLTLGARIVVQRLTDINLVSEPELTLIPLQKSEKSNETLLYKITAQLNTSGPIILSHGTLMAIDGVDYLVSSPELSPFLLTENGLQSIKFGPLLLEPIKTSWGTSLPFKKVGANSFITSIRGCLPINVGLRPPGYLELFHRLTCLVDTSFGNVSSPQSVLLYGPRGSGKSFLVQTLINHVLNNNPNTDVDVSRTDANHSETDVNIPIVSNTHVQVIDCKTLRGKRPETIQKIVSKEFAKSVFHQPSLLVLEDIDTLVPKSVQEESGPEQLQNHRIALILLSFWTSYVKQKFDTTKILIASTAKSIEGINELMTHSKGHFFFTDYIEIKPPDCDQRESILRSLYTESKIGLEWNIPPESQIIKTLTNGYLPGDLKSLVEQVVHEFVKRKSGLNVSNLNVSSVSELFESVLESFIPTSLRGLNLKTSSSRKLSDIGGLNQVKEELLETLLWPFKYPILYSKIPVPSNNNILLHGPSGTGKTMIAEAIATEIGIHFLKVEGPELLSKYIGASEMAIRDIFKKAQSIKPVILFFDEFDSIAPRRGHDSTGVTDRVVNQLLTQLDGIEDIDQGIFVLAATNRIDLIDPALLRPGRFNKCLYFPIPNENERIEILQILAKNLILDQSVHLEKVAQITDGYTGADIQALLCTAQLAAFHEVFDSKVSKVADGSSGLTQNNLNLEYYRSLNESKSSDPPTSVIAEVESIFNNLRGESIKSSEEVKMEVRITMDHLVEAIKSTKASVKKESGSGDG